MAKKTVRVRLFHNVLGENPDPNPDNGLETLSKGSVVDVSADFGALLVGSKRAEYVEDRTPLYTAELTHAPAPGSFGGI